MRERPILFSAPMVRALLAGTKTQTRRGVTHPVLEDLPEIFHLGDGWWGDEDCRARCPYGLPGDQLWVREAWRAEVAFNNVPPRDITACVPIWHEAQDDVPFHPSAFGKLRPSMFMPRWASRLTLEVTEVRVERLQDISDADARAEGARECDPVSGREVLLAGASQRGGFVLHHRDIWEQIIGPGSWAANPWVWVVGSTVIPPEDAKSQSARGR